MPLKGLECQASKLVNRDACPRPTTMQERRAGLWALTFKFVQWCGGLGGTVRSWFEVRR
jgi:hypothetical protein